MKKHLMLCAALGGCGSAPKTMAQLATALAAPPTGTVDAKTAKQLVKDNQLRDGLATAMGTAEQRIPYGYATLSETACTNVPKDSGQTKELSLANSGDGVSTGNVTSILKCKATGGFTFELNLRKACVADECFEGLWNVDATDSKIVWALRGSRQSGNSTVKTVVDMGGQNDVASDGKFTNAKLIAFIGDKEPQPTIILDWGTGGPNKYTQFSLTGKNGKFLCASTDGGNTGDCSSVDAAGKPTNVGDFAF